MEPGKLYHIYNRGNNRETIFKSPENYDFFLRRFKEYLADKVAVHAYCLMPNHFHFLIEILDEAEIPVQTFRQLTPVEKGFKNLFISYSKAINKAHNRTGSLFQPKFKKKEVNKELYYARLIAYIHLNPVKAGYCLKYESWRYSSYNAFIKEGKTLVKKVAVLEWFGSKEAFVEHHQIYIKDAANEQIFEAGEQTSEVLKTSEV